MKEYLVVKWEGKDKWKDMVHRNAGIYTYHPFLSHYSLTNSTTSIFNYSILACNNLAVDNILVLLSFSFSLNYKIMTRFNNMPSGKPPQFRDQKWLR